MQVQQGQTLLDVALQLGGDASRVFDIAIANGIGITDDLTAGDMIEEITPTIESESTAAFFQRNPNQVASADLVQSTPAGPQGINYWAIEKDFKVS